MKNSLHYQKIHALRERVLSNTVGFLNPIYKTIMPRNRAWTLTKTDLRQFPTATLGKDLANFMDANNFDILPYLETHDIYHVLLGYQPTIVEEARLYFCLFGNGKYSFEVINTVLVSLVLLPDYWGDLFRHYERGRACRSIAKWDFRYLLHEDTEVLKGIIFEQKAAKFFV
jgi:hypothetical protein